MRTFSEIFNDIANTVQKRYQENTSRVKSEIIDATTRIYIAELVCNTVNQTINKEENTWQRNQ